MKKNKWLMVGGLLIIIGIACFRYITKDEKDRQYPVERYREQESQQDNANNIDALEHTNTDEGDTSHSMTIGNFSYDFLWCDIVDDTEIEIQTKYPAKWFDEGKIPDADYQTNLLWDYEAMYRENPQLENIKDVVLNPYSYSEEEYEALVEPYRSLDEGDKYRIEGHPKSRYYFVKLRITNNSNKSREVALNNLYLIQTNEIKSYAVTSDYVIYFDKAQHTEGDDRIHRFCWYTMQPKEILECVIGYEMDEHSLYDLHDERLMYIGILSDDIWDKWVNPVLSKTVVPLYDLPETNDE